MRETSERSYECFGREGIEEEREGEREKRGDRKGKREKELERSPLVTAR